MNNLPRLIAPDRYPVDGLRIICDRLKINPLPQIETSLHAPLQRLHPRPLRLPHPPLIPTPHLPLSTLGKRPAPMLSRSA